MNHLTNLYKHKCEQLQEHINNLKRMLNEADIPAGFPGTTIYGPPDPNPFDIRWINPEPGNNTSSRLISKNNIATVPPGFEPKSPFRNPVGTPPAAPKGTDPPPCTCEIGSEEWKKWIRKKGNWTYENIHPYGTPAWEAYELNKARDRVKK
jgi:hypothetical protein